MEIDHTNREVIEVYLIGAVILFTLSVAGTFLISFLGSTVDLLIPLKALSMYTVMAFLVLNYITYNHLEGVGRWIALFLEIAVQLAAAVTFVPYLGKLLGQSQMYSMAGFPRSFMVLPSLSLMFAIAGVFVVTYYSVDI